MEHIFNELGGVNMACQNNNQCCNQTTNTNTGHGFVIIIVLYILLAIILGACLY